MKKSLKVLALVMGAILLVCGSVAATLAWLKDTATVENTFTVGNVAITLDEALVDNDGQEIVGTGADRSNAGNIYKLIPGRQYDKDPTIHVAAGSENCYLFVRVQNDIATIESGTTVAAQMATNGWVAVPGESGVYYKGTNSEMTVINAGSDHIVFANFTIAGTTTDAQLATIDNTKVISVTAYAIQAEGMTGKTPAEVWALAH